MIDKMTPLEIWLIPNPSSGNWKYNAARRIGTAIGMDSAERFARNRVAHDNDASIFFRLEIREVPAPPEYDL